MVLVLSAAAFDGNWRLLLLLLLLLLRFVSRSRLDRNRKMIFFLSPSFWLFRYDVVICWDHIMLLIHIGNAYTTSGMSINFVPFFNKLFYLTRTFLLVLNGYRHTEVEEAIFQPSYEWWTDTWHRNITFLRLCVDSITWEGKRFNWTSCLH